MIYVYAVFSQANKVAASWPDALIPSKQIEIIEVAKGVQVIASEVPAQLFEASGAPDGTTLAEDPAWLAEAALSHHAIIVEAHHCGDVLPLRFGTVFRTRQDLLRQFALDEQAWRSRLHRIAGREEYEIRLSIDASRMEDSRIESRCSEWSCLPPGRRYLAERAARRQVQDQLIDVEQMAWKRFEFGLGPLVSASHQRSNGTRVYLVEKNCNSFLDYVEKIRVVEDGLAFEVAGIWPPYSFSGGDIEAGPEMNELGQSGRVLNSPAARSDLFGAHSLGQ